MIGEALTGKLSCPCERSCPFKSRPYFGKSLSDTEANSMSQKLSLSAKIAEICKGDPCTLCILFLIDKDDHNLVSKPFINIQAFDLFFSF